MALVALFVAAVALRPNLIGLGPLLPEVGRDLDVAHGMAGLLAAIPVLCMGLVAPFAPRLTATIGARRGLAVGLAVIGIAGILRAIAPSLPTILVLTVPIGLAIGIGGALLPIVVKDRLPLQASLATGVYTTAIQLGASAAAFLAIPLLVVTGGWRGTLVVFSLVAFVAVALWVLLTPSGAEPAGGGTGVSARPSRDTTRSAWRDPVAWFLGVLFWLCAFPFYGLISWLASALVERGWAPFEAGALVATVSLAGLPGSMIVGWMADRYGSRRSHMLSWAVIMTFSVAGFVVVPELAPLWAVASGVAIGATFTLTLILPLDIAPDPKVAGATIGVVLSVGYVLTSATPVLLGLLRDISGSFDASIWVSVLISGLVIPASLFLTRSRLAGH